MAAQSSLKNMVMCLTLVCLFCSAILGVVYAVTYEPIQKANIEKANKAIAEVTPEFDSVSEQLSVEVDGTQYPYYIVSKEGETVGCAVKSSVIGFGGPVVIMVGITSDGNIYNTSVLEHSETPGLGAKCSDPSFKDQFKNWNPSLKSLTVSKDGGAVDAITAATITSRAYALAISNALKAFESIKEEE